MPYIHVNEIELYYEIHPATQPDRQDKTPLLLIMGLGLNSLSWQKNLPYLTEKHSVIVFDNRGTGRSSKPDYPYTIRMLAEDAAGLLKALHIRRTHVFGFSLGSLIAQELALHHTHLVKSLILGASTTGGLHHIAPPPGVIDRMVQRGWVEPSQAARMVIPIIYSEKFIREKSEQIEMDTATRLFYPTPSYAYRRQMVAAMYHDTWTRLDQLAMPVLLITGDADKLIVPENTARLASRLPHPETVIFPGVGHYFTSEEPKRSCEVIIEFLERHFGKRSSKTAA